MVNDGAAAAVPAALESAARTAITRAANERLHIFIDPSLPVGARSRRRKLSCRIVNWRCVKSIPAGARLTNTSGAGVSERSELPDHRDCPHGASLLGAGGGNPRGKVALRAQNAGGLGRFSRRDRP